MIRQALDLVHRPLRAVFGVQADEDHEDRHERNGDDDNGRTDPVGDEHADQDDRRNGRRRDERRQEPRVVAVEVVQPLRGEHGDRADAARDVPTAPGRNALRELAA